MRIAITGGTGFIGSALTRHFDARGDAVTIVTRSRAARGGTAGGGGVDAGGARRPAAWWDPEGGHIDRAALEGHEAVIHLAGESIAGVWTPGKRQRILDSRQRGTRLLAATLAALQSPPRVLFTASGYNVYGDRGAEPVDEDTPPGAGFMAAVVTKWEAAAGTARDAGIRVVHLRFGNVLSPAGGFLQALLPWFRFGLGARFGDGRGYWPWVARAEIPFVVDHLLARDDVHGPVNVAAPEVPTNDELTRAIAGAVGRPRLLVVPAFLARLAPGGMGDELLLSSVRVVPRRLRESGYTFRHPALRPALDAMLKAERRDE